MKIKKVVIDGKPYYELTDIQLRAINTIPDDFDGSAVINIVKANANKIFVDFKNTYEQKYGYNKLDNKGSIVRAKNFLTARVKSLESQDVYTMTMKFSDLKKIADIKDCLDGLKKRVDEKLSELDDKLANLDRVQELKKEKADAKKFLKAYLVVNERLDMSDRKVMLHCEKLSEKEIDALTGKNKK